MNNYYDKSTLRKMRKHNSKPSPYLKEKKIKPQAKYHIGDTFVTCSRYGMTINDESIILLIYNGYYQRTDEIYHMFKTVLGERNNASENGLWTSIYGDGFLSDKYEISDWGLSVGVQEKEFVQVDAAEAAKIILLGEITDENYTFQY